MEMLMRKMVDVYECERECYLSGLTEKAARDERFEIECEDIIYMATGDEREALVDLREVLREKLDRLA